MQTSTKHRLDPDAGRHDFDMSRYYRHQISNRASAFRRFEKRRLIRASRRAARRNIAA